MDSTSRIARPSSPTDETPTINTSTEIEPLEIVDRKMKKPLENHCHSAASSSGITPKDDNHGGALSPSSRINNHLLLLDSSLENFVVDLKTQIKQARDKLALGSSERDFDEVRKAITKIKVPIRSARSADSKPHNYKWPNINGVEDGMMGFFFEEPKSEHAGDLEGRTEAFHELPEPWRCCLLCFFKFPPKAFIKRTTMIYLWISQGYIFQHLQEEYPQKEKEELDPLEDDAGKMIFDELIAKDFLERCSFEPNSCRMSLSDRSSLYNIAEDNGFTSSHGALDVERAYGCLAGNSCLINVGEAILTNKLKIFENVKNIRSLYLGRWQSSAEHDFEKWKRSAEHHIELEDIKNFHGLKKLDSLTFVSLRGISLITELPTFILELNDLKILDLRACHNLGEIPDNISLFKNLTHLDISECYFLEHMPKSLAQLSNLEVLKGFLIGYFKNDNQSCTLYDLSILPKLRKLNIYTSVEEFPTLSDLVALKNFQGLLKLTISWGGCSSYRKTDGAAALASRPEGFQTLPLRLQKLDIQGFPMRGLPRWLWPENLKELKKLYIRGGKLCDLGQLREHQEQNWNVEILHLKYLSELDTDWSKLRILFPKLIYLRQIECPKLTNFQGDKSGVWMHKQEIDTRLWLQKFFRSDGNSLSSLLGYGPNKSGVWMHKQEIDTRLWLQKFFRSDGNSLSSLLGYGPNIAQDDSEICPLHRKKP